MTPRLSTYAARLFSTALLAPALLALQGPELGRPIDCEDADPGEPLVWLVEPAQVEAFLRGGWTPSAAPSAQGGTQELGAAVCDPFTTSEVFTGVLPEGDLPSGVAFTPDGAKIVVSHTLSQNLVVLDAATRVVTDTIALSGSPQGVAVSADGVHAVTANIFEDTASIVDLSTGLETAVVPIGNQPGGVCITPDGTRAVVSNVVDLSLSVIDIASATELHRIPGAGFAATIALTPENGVARASFSQFACASNSIVILPDFGNDEIDFFDIVAGTVTSVASTPRPIGVDVNPSGTTAVISHYFPETSCSVVDVATQTITKNIDVGQVMYGPIAVNPAGTSAVCGVQNNCVVVDLVTNAVSSNISTASVNQLHTTADGLYALAVGYRGSLISYASQSLVTNLNNYVACYVGGVSPAGPRAAMAAIHNGENLLVMNTSGAGAFLEGDVPSGPPAEADKTRRVAVSADGTRAVTTNILSDNVTIVNLATNTVEGVVAVGDRPSGVAITPDGTKAVVANLDSTFVSVVDLVAQTSTSVSISTRASEVAISPGGQYAYVAVVVSDGVWRIDLNSLAVSGGKITTGNMGSTLTYMFVPASGIALSHDGATLAVCGSFDDVLSIIDTASWSLVASVPVAGFPFRAVFSPDDSTIYVTAKNGDQLVRVSNAGAASAVTGSVATGADPYEMLISADGQTLYLGDYGAQRLALYDLASFSLTGTVPLSVKPQALLARGTCVTTTGGNWSVGSGPSGVFFGADGAVVTVDTVGMTVTQDEANVFPPSELVAIPGADAALIPSPFIDGLLRVDFAGDDVSALCYGDGSGAVCPCGNLGAAGEGCRNSTGSGALMVHSGVPSVGTDTLVFSGSQLPATAPGLYFQGDLLGGGGAGTPFGDGLLCASGNIQRLGVVFSAGGQSAYPGAGDPLISVKGAVSAGELRFYQLWYRDLTGPCSGGFNTSNALEVLWGL